MLKESQVKKTNLQCRTDKNPCTIRCPKCEINQRSHSKLFKTPESLWRHLWQSHTLDKNEHPSTEETIQILEKISAFLRVGASLSQFSEAKKLGMIVR